MVELWDVAEEVSIATLPHTHWVSTVAFSHDGEILATGSEDKTVKLWDVATETNIATFKEHTAQITSLSFSPDRGTLAVGQADGKVKLWDIATETSIKTLEEHTRTVTVLFSPDERILATGSLDNTILLWDVATWRVISPLEGPRDSLGTRAMSFSFDGTILATGSFYRGTIELWDMTMRQHIVTLPGHIGSVDAVSFSPDGETLASGSADFTVKLWDVETGVNLTTFNGHWHWVESVSFSGDGTLLASASHDKSIKLWDLSDVMDLRRNALVSVNIPDPILRAAITTAFGKPSDAIVYTGDMTELIRLKKESANIKDLSGIETAHNLKRLDLAENNISDISHVAGLTKLTSLNLRENNISDISHVAGLTKLTSLNLGENEVSDISHVAGLTKLDSLALHQNNISDISHVAGLTKLRYLGVMDNLVSDISHVAGLTKLTFLDIGGNSVSDISHVAKLTDLQYLAIGNNLISDISHVAKLKYLDLLHCPNNLISDISHVAELKYLTRLIVSFNRISDLSPVAELTNLKLLQFRGNNISDLSPLVENTGLGEGDEVHVQDNPLSYASIHTHIPTLQKRGVKVIFDDQSPTTFLKISEIMVASNEGRLPQWIELYNRSTTHAINLKDWTLEIQNHRSEDFAEDPNVTLTFKEKSIEPQGTLLIVSKQGRSSDNFLKEQIYNLSTLHPLLPDTVLNENGFYMKLSNVEGKLIDEVGNLDGKKNTNDKPTWRLPKSITKDGARTSMIRRQVNGTSLLGTEAFGWISAKNTKLVNKTTNYYGHLHDIGSPGIESGGALPVQLSKFRAEQTEAGVILKWTTESEIDNAGFNILRSETRNGTFKTINPKLIQGAGTTGERSTYSWTDTTAKPNTVYYYRIEDVSHAGVRQQLATVRLRGLVSAKGKLTTKWGDLKRQE